MLVDPGAGCTQVRRIQLGAKPILTSIETDPRFDKDADIASPIYEGRGCGKIRASAMVCMGSEPSRSSDRPVIAANNIVDFYDSGDHGREKGHFGAAVSGQMVNFS